MIAPDLARFLDSLPEMPWFLNLGKPHPRDREVVRIRRWKEWPGPEGGWADWFGRDQAVVREKIEEKHRSRHAELAALWGRVEDMVLRSAAANVPLYDLDEDAWYGPTACVWCAAYTACLASWNLLLWRPVPASLADEWTWYMDGHWPCDYAEEPPGYLDEGAVYVPSGKLMVY